MAIKTYFLQVKEITQETDNTITIYFWHPLSEQIKYKAGQFVTVIVPAGEGGKRIRRSYSMSTSPHTDTAIGVTVKRIANGLVSNYLHDKVKVGDFIEVVEPMGNFVIEPNAESNRQIVLVGAGSGITPLISIAKSVLKLEPHSSILLIYGNRNENSIIFRAKLDEMEANHRERFKVHHILSSPSEYWPSLKGRISQGLAIRLIKEESINLVNAEYYLCGPADMMEEVIKGLNIYEVNPAQIHRENFFAPVLDESDTTDSPQNHIVKVIYEGETHEFEVKPHQTILEAALDLDIDLPYSCQAGMCTACMGKCIEGKVKMDEEEGLTEKEINQGYVLTCVSHPISQGVVIEID